ncbi:lipase secretion chaperone [Ahniella affigens]|uniref:lipase secretion chaperone n=1 Tax=Ahniella affigens TaxID=2021234 RepID=UPI001472F956|nr:lipase secretion chaperone [Ahniella affigens]
MYAILMFVAMVIASIVWRLIHGAADVMLPPAPSAVAVPAPTDETTATSTSPDLQTAPAASTLAATSTPGVTAADLAPPSLRGSEVDGSLTIANGRVLPNLELRRLFDYFLTGLGEMDVPAIRNWLQAYVRERYGDAAVAETLSLFDRYVELGLASASAELNALDQRQRLAALKALRTKLLGSEMAAAFFAEEEQYLGYTLDRLDILNNAALSESERDQALQALEAQLPPTVRESIHQATLGVVAEEQTRELDARGADAATRHAEREALVGRDAADRLATLDQQRALWDQRVAAYKAEHARIMSLTGLSADTRQQQLAAWLAQQFTPEERTRIEALQAIGAL